MQVKAISKPKKPKLRKDQPPNLSKLWLEWHVVKDGSSDEDLLSFDFKLIEKQLQSTEDHKVAIPILALYHLAEKYNWLQVLRGPKHRPTDPYELVRFIQMLESNSYT